MISRLHPRLRADSKLPQAGTDAPMQTWGKGGLKTDRPKHVVGQWALTFHSGIINSALESEIPLLNFVLILLAMRHVAWRPQQAASTLHLQQRNASTQRRTMDWKLQLPSS